MRRTVACGLLVLVLGSGLAACGGGDDGGAELEQAVPAGASAEAREGAKVLGSSGCLACHRIGESGNGGPGPGLDGVADRLSPEALRSVLVEGRSPMPSFESLGDEKLDQLVAYLGTL